MPGTEARRQVGLPPRPFLYAPDQIATLLGLKTQKVLDDYLYYIGVSYGPRPKTKMPAIDIAPDGQKPIWRVSEQDLISWLRRMGWRVMNRRYVSAE